MATASNVNITRIDPFMGASMTPFGLNNSRMDTREITEDDLISRLNYLQKQKSIRALSPQELEEIGTLTQEISDRTQRKSGVEQGIYEKLFSDGSGGGSTGGVSDFGKSLAAREAAAIYPMEEARGNIAKIFSSQRTAQEQALKDRYVANRRRAIDELGATGNLRNVGARNATLGELDQSYERSLDDLINSLTGQEAGALLDFDKSLANAKLQNNQFYTNAGAQNAQFGADFGLRERLGKAGLIQSARGQQQSYDLANRQFLEGMRQNAYSEGMQQRQIAAAEEAARRQAENEDTGFLGDFTSILGGIGSLAAGGGTLAGGIGAFNMARGMLGNKKTSTPAFNPSATYGSLFNRTTNPEQKTGIYDWSKLFYGR